MTINREFCCVSSWITLIVEWQLLISLEQICVLSYFLKASYEEWVSQGNLITNFTNEQKINWLAVQLIEATCLLNSNTSTVNGIGSIGKAEEPGREVRENLYVLCSFCQHFVFMPSLCSAGPETLGMKEAWPWSLSGSAGFVQPQGEFRKCSCDKQFMHGKGKALHVTSSS